MKAPNAKRIAIREYLENPTPERYERMVEQVRAALCRVKFGANWRTYFSCYAFSQSAPAALRAIGITPRSGGKGRK
jgi:hypothetical protein